MTRLSRRSFLASAAAAALPAAAQVPSSPVVVGAGAAGLAATRTLMDLGFSVATVEARDRIGGRAHTESKTFGVPYDHGCHWLHNAYMNPFVAFARANGFNVYPSGSGGYGLYDGPRRPGNAAWLEIEAAYNAATNAILDAGREGHDVDAASVITDDGPWAPLVACYIGGWSMGKDLKDISCVDYWKSEGGSSEGFGTLIAHDGRDLPVALETPVSSIDWSGDGVRVATSSGTIEARAVIVTASTGMLASGGLRFTPALDPQKEESFHRISMGTCNHIALKFSRDIFGLGNDGSFEYRPETTDAVGFLTNISGSNLAFGYVGGDFGRELVAEGNDAAIAFGLEKIKASLGNDTGNAFVEGNDTAWDNDPWTHGSYASADPGYAWMRSVLKEPVADRVFFAGEACHSLLWATAAGALVSGQDVAAEVARRIA